MEKIFEYEGGGSRNGCRSNREEGFLDLLIRAREKLFWRFRSNCNGKHKSKMVDSISLDVLEKIQERNSNILRGKLQIIYPIASKIKRNRIFLAFAIISVGQKETWLWELLNHI